MIKKPFRKPPLTPAEKEKSEQDFINGAETKQPTIKEEKIKPLLVRLPESLWKELKQASLDKERTMTELCIDAIRKKVRNKK